MVSSASRSFSAEALVHALAICLLGDYHRGPTGTWLTLPLWPSSIPAGLKLPYAHESKEAGHQGVDHVKTNGQKGLRKWEAESLSFLQLSGP